jgi:hypothetical protein
MFQDGARRTAQMKERHHTPEQVLRKLAEGEKPLGEGQTIEEGRMSTGSSADSGQQ